MAEKRSKGSGWGLFLLFWTMLLLMLGFLVCVVFYKYTAVYEETRPERTMDALMMPAGPSRRGTTTSSTPAGGSWACMTSLYMAVTRLNGSSPA